MTTAAAVRPATTSAPSQAGRTARSQDGREVVCATSHLRDPEAARNWTLVPLLMAARLGGMVAVDPLLLVLAFAAVTGPRPQQRPPVRGPDALPGRRVVRLVG